MDYETDCHRLRSAASPGRPVGRLARILCVSLLQQLVHSYVCSLHMVTQGSPLT